MGPEKINNHIASFLMKLYKDPRVSRPKLEGLDFKRIFDTQRSWLEHPFQEGEIKNIV